MREKFDGHKFHDLCMQQDVRGLEFMASDRMRSSQELAVINGALRIKRHQAAIAADEACKAKQVETTAKAQVDAEKAEAIAAERKAQREADEALMLRSVLAAEASARWAKWSMVIAFLALVAAIGIPAVGWLGVVAH